MVSSNKRSMPTWRTISLTSSVAKMRVLICCVQCLCEFKITVAMGSGSHGNLNAPRKPAYWVDLLQSATISRSWAAFRPQNLIAPYREFASLASFDYRATRDGAFAHGTSRSSAASSMKSVQDIYPLSPMQQTMLFATSANTDIACFTVIPGYSGLGDVNNPLRRLCDLLLESLENWTGRPTIQSSPPGPVEVERCSWFAHNPRGENWLIANSYIGIQFDVH